MRNACLLVFENKQYLQHFMPIAEVTENIGLRTVHDRLRSIQYICLFALKWLKTTNISVFT